MMSAWGTTLVYLWASTVHGALLVADRALDVLAATHVAVLCTVLSDPRSCEQLMMGRWTLLRRWYVRSLVIPEQDSLVRVSSAVFLHPNDDVWSWCRFERYRFPSGGVLKEAAHLPQVRKPLW